VVAETCIIYGYIWRRVCSIFQAFASDVFVFWVQQVAVKIRSNDFPRGTFAHIIGQENAVLWSTIVRADHLDDAVAPSAIYSLSPRVTAKTTTSTRWVPNQLPVRTGAASLEGNLSRSGFLWRLQRRSCRGDFEQWYTKSRR